MKGFSTTVASTWLAPRTLSAKLYQASVRVQYSGRFLVATCPRSATLTVPVWTAVRLVARVPSSSVRNGQSGSVSMAEPRPRKPPPAWK